MGNKDSSDKADRFFLGLGGIAERGANSAISMMTLPQQLMKSATDFISSPMGSIMIPIMGIGALYVITQIKK